MGKLYLSLKLGTSRAVQQSQAGRLAPAGGTYKDMSLAFPQALQVGLRLY